MVLGNKYNSLQLTTTTNGYALRVWDGCDHCEIELTQGQAAVVAQCLSGVRCADCEKLVKECDCRTMRIETGCNHTTNETE